MSGRDRFETWAALSPIRTGVLVALTAEGEPLVADASDPQAPVLAARSIVELDGSQVGAQVMIACTAGDDELPVVLGVLHGGARRAQSLEVHGDGERIVVSAREHLVLRCGKASITLTRAGKVLIEGAYVLSRSSGVNRIKGGSVQLN